MCGSSPMNFGQPEARRNHPRRPPGAHVRLRPSRDRAADQGTAHPPDHPRFDAAAIASAFLIAPAAMGQRLCARQDQDQRSRHSVPVAPGGRAIRAPRCRARGDLCCLRRRLDGCRGHRYAPARSRSRRHLARPLVVSLLPDEPEPWAPRTHASCRGAAPGTRDQAGNYVPLGEQDADLWDKEMIAEAEALLRAASRMDAAGRYQLEAAVQSAHAVRRLTGRPDWAAIETLI